MKIAVIGANGQAGKRIVAEAVSRGLDVTAVVRSDNHTVAKNVIPKDVFALTATDLADFDAVVSALAFWTSDTVAQHTTALMHLADLLKGKATRLLVVGGAGSLYTDASQTTQLVDTPDFPEEYKLVASNMAKGLAALRQYDDVQWTYISPAAEFVADGAKTGKYRLAGEVFTVNAKGESTISYADYAAALVDELVNGKHLHARISVLGE